SSARASCAARSQRPMEPVDRTCLDFATPARRGERVIRFSEVLSFDVRAIEESAPPRAGMHVFQKFLGCKVASTEQKQYRTGKQAQSFRHAVLKYRLCRPPRFACLRGRDLPRDGCDRTWHIHVAAHSL